MRRTAFALLLVPSVAVAGGRGVLSGASDIYQTAAEARAAAPGAVTAHDAVSVQILAVHGDVVHVATAGGDDCVKPVDQAYELTGYIARPQLIPRLAKRISTSFQDGTAIAIDIGAPVVEGRFVDPFSAAAVPTIKHSQTTLAVTWAEAFLPFSGEERVVCSNGVQTAAEYDNDAVRRRREGTLAEYDQPFDLAAACGISGPTLNGVAVDGPATYFVRSYRVGDHGLGDRETVCGEVRVAGALSHSDGGGGATVASGDHRTQFKPGPLFWPDGKPAGKLVRYVDDNLQDEKIGTMLCHDVPHVAQKVCHRAADAVVWR